MKKFTAGLLTGVILASSITTFAASGRMIEVFDNVKKVVVNKIEKPFDKDNKPFAYNGTTYVPLRFVADALGEAVSWDGKTGTVYIGETNNKNAHYWEKDIKKMNIQQRGGLNWSYWYDTKGETARDNLNNVYSNFLVMGIDCNGLYYNSYQLMEFPLSGKYKEFNATVAPTNDYLESSAMVDVNIYLDEEKVYSMTVTNGNMPKNININTTGANKIGFEIVQNSNYKGSSSIKIGFFNGEFIK